MASNQDARPFIDLQKDAEEFQAKFEEDIEKCKSILDTKITSLICDPDSLGNSVGPKQNALVEFSKAKYDIYISMKSLMNDMEREWLKYISEMKKLFIDNVEVFLANTKLEVKLPSSGYLPSTGPKKSPGLKKSTAVTSSIYPIISSITKSIPVFSQKDKSLDLEMETDETEMDLNKSWSATWQKSKFNERVDLGRSSVFSTENAISDDEDADEEKPPSHDNAKGKKNQFPGQSLKRNGLQDHLNNSDISENDEEITEIEQYFPQPLSRGGGRKSRFTTQNRKVNEKPPKNVSSSESHGEMSEFESGVTRVSSRKSLSRSSSRSKAFSKESSNNTSDESEEIKETETNNNSVSLKGPRRRQAPKNKTNAKTFTEEISNNTFDDSGEIKETETNNNNVCLKGRRRRQGPKNKTNAKMLEQEMEVAEPVYEEEPTVTSIITESRRGRNRSAAAKNVKNVAAVTSVITETRRGRNRSAAAKNVKNVDEVTSFISENHRGKSAAKNSANVSDKTSRADRSSRRKTVIERVIETETSVLPNTVTFTAEDDINDDHDMYTPVARPSKSATRRKTLLPNLEESVPGPDIIPGNYPSARSKRKTFSVSDLSSVAPSKRLKSCNIQKSNATAKDYGVAADNNLLETDDNYSEWIALKNIDGQIPANPAIYEVKVWRAKKSAYIGCCDSLRQKLTLHKLGQNSGHKHLDKFIERNFDDIQIRFEVVSSVNDAKVEVKNRVNSFVAQHKTTPAYN